MRLGAIGIGDPLRRAALMSHLAAVLLVRLAAQTAGDARRLLQSVARGGLLLFELSLLNRRWSSAIVSRCAAFSRRNAAYSSQSQLTPKRPALSPKGIEVASKRVDWANRTGN